MKISKLYSAIIVALFLIPVIPGVLAVLPTAVSVATDQPYYHSGDVVKVSGLATAAGAVSITFKVGENTIATASATVDVDGKYQNSYTIPVNPEIGTWTVIAQDSATKSGSTTFNVLNATTLDIVQKLIDIADNTKTYIKGILVSQPSITAQANFDAGSKALDETRILLGSAKYAASLNTSLRAQRYFATALKILAVGHSGENEVNESTRLANQIDRAQKILDSLKKVYDNIKEKLAEDKSSTINTELTAAQTAINTAKTQLPSDEIAAKLSLTTATGHLATAKDLIQVYANDKKKDQILSFIDKAEERIDKLKVAVEKLRARLGNTEANALILKLDGIRTKLEELKELVNNSATIEELNTKMREIQDVIGGVHDFSLREGLKEMDSMQAWIQDMKDARGVMMKKGLKTDDLDVHIKKGEDEIGSTISELAAGKKMNGKFSEIIKEFKGHNQNHDG